MTCPICGSPDVAKQFDIPYLPPFRVERCAVCGTGITAPEVDDIARFYPTEYYGQSGRKFNVFIEFLVFVSRLRRAQRIERYVEQGRVLDVGCGGRTHFLSRMNERGWEAHGNELFEFPNLKALEEEGVHFRVGDFLKLDYAADFFDVAVFWHVLEHLTHPIDAIEKSRRILRPGGLLVLALPNSGSLQASWAGPSWFHLDVPRHYFHFTLTRLEHELATRGFEILYVSHFSFEQDIFAWMQSLYNRLGFRHNLLYNFLRTRHAKMYGFAGADLFQLCAIFALMPVVGPVSVLLFLLEVILRRGGSMEIYARKL